MIDIVNITYGSDLSTFDSDAPRAANILSVQQGSLDYAQDVGIDLAFFLSDAYQFQNESFKAYLVERLAFFGINVSSLTDTVESLLETYTLNLAPAETSTGLIAR